MTLFARFKQWLLGLVHWRQPDVRGHVQETKHADVFSEQVQPPRPQFATRSSEEPTESRHDEETKPSQSAPEPEPAPAPADAPAEEAQCAEEEPRPNRKARRAQKSDARRFYEKQRRKFDQFVEPQGTPPTPIDRTTPSTPADPTAAQSVADAEDDEKLIIDCHHSDRKTKVLYDHHEVWGEFTFRDTVLGQLERNLFYLNRMRKHDPSAYEFYRRVGTMLIPYAAVPDIYKTWHKDDKETPYVKMKKLSPWFLETRPAFGCIAYGTSPEVQRIEDEENADAEHKHMLIPRFLYFTKYLPQGAPPDLQPIRRAGDVYKMTVWWDKDKKKFKHGRPSDFGVFVSKAGDITVLKMNEAKTRKIESKKHGSGYIHRREWCIPHGYEEWAQHHGTNAQMFLGCLFADLADCCEHSAYPMARVSVKKGENFVMFGIDPHRLPYFFKDRDYVLNDKGHRVPVFHCVRPHTVNGKARGFQFRGARKFTWAGYQVEITIPGLHHKFWDELDVGVLDWSKRKKLDAEDAVKTEVIGEMIRADMDGRNDDLDDIKEELRRKRRANEATRT